MRNLAKEFKNIIQGYIFEPHEMKVIKAVIEAVNIHEKENEGCYGCIHLTEKQYTCEQCARFGHIDYYTSK